MLFNAIFFPNVWHLVCHRNLYLLVVNLNEDSFSFFFDLDIKLFNMANVTNGGK